MQNIYIVPNQTRKKTYKSLISFLSLFFFFLRHIVPVFLIYVATTLCVLFNYLLVLYSGVMFLSDCGHIYLVCFHYLLMYYFLYLNLFSSTISLYKTYLFFSSCLCLKDIGFSVILRTVFCVRGEVCLWSFSRFMARSLSLTVPLKSSNKTRVI